MVYKLTQTANSFFFFFLLSSSFPFFLSPFPSPLISQKPSTRRNTRGFRGSKDTTAMHSSHRWGVKELNLMAAKETATVSKTVLFGWILGSDRHPLLSSHPFILLFPFKYGCLGTPENRFSLHSPTRRSITNHIGLAHQERRRQHLQE